MENEAYLYGLIASNLIASLVLILAIKRPNLARLFIFMLFTWACWMNWKTAIQNPNAYLEYADLTWSGWYRSFILGWFADHILLAVGFIATCQGCIAISMLLKGPPFYLGAMGSILFLLAIIPFGVGAGFPSTGILATAMFILVRNHNNKFIWRSTSRIQDLAIESKADRSFNP